MKHVGITGHQGLTAGTRLRVASALALEIKRRAPICAVSSLAEGPDQLFATEALRQGGTLVVVVPSLHYENSFSEPEAVEEYRKLLGRASEVFELKFEQPGEDAYWAAGRRVVKLADELIAVWDGKKAAGLGGTGDVVAFAREVDVPVTTIWPDGSTRR